MFSSHVKGSPLEGAAQSAPVSSASREKDLSRAERKALRLAEERSAKALREAARQAEKADRAARKAAAKTAPKGKAAAAPAVQRTATAAPGALAPAEAPAPAPAQPKAPEQQPAGKQKQPRKPRKEKARKEKARKDGAPKKRRGGITIKLARHPQESRPKAPLQPAVVLKPKPSRKELARRQAEIDPYAPPAKGGIDLALSSLVLGTVAFALAWIPLVKYVGAAFAALGVLLAVIDARRDEAQGWLPGVMTRWARTLSVAALVVVVATTGLAIKSGMDADKKASGHATGAVLDDDLGTKFGEFTETKDAVGVTHRGLELTIRNKSGGVKDFDILVEAVNGNGERITSEQLNPRNMRPGQEVKYTLFQYVDELTAHALKTAEVRIGSASSH